MKAISAASRFKSLELAGPRLRPAFDDNFFVGVKLDRVAPLTMKHAKKTVAPSAKRKIGHGCGNAYINPHISGGNFVAKFSCGRAAARENRRHVAVRAPRKNFNALLE